MTLLVALALAGCNPLVSSEGVDPADATEDAAAAARLFSSSSWTAESDQTGAQLGYAVSSAGDVNGDGYGDVIVGAFNYNAGNGGEGRAYVFLGSATGLSDTATWTAQGEEAGAAFGYSVASAGDVNGDGYSDVIVGAYLHDEGQINEGRVYVYLGSSSWPTTAAPWTAEPDQVAALFGTSVAAAGDVDNDGYGDVIVGAPNADDDGQTDEGWAFVYRGSSTGMSAAAPWIFESDQAGASLGYWVSGAGDVNGDGFGDVVVGAPNYDGGLSNEGRATVYLGSSSGLSTGAGWFVESEQADAHAGFSVAGAGDVTGDGYADVVVGAIAYDNGEADEGRVTLYKGSSTGLSSAGTFEANQASAQVGSAVSGAGDVNGDGYADIIVGAPSYTAGESFEGRTYVLLGQSGGLTGSPWTAESNQADASFGIAVSGAGDVDGDGFGDVVIGAFRYDGGHTNEGRATLYRGAGSAPALTANWTMEIDAANSAFGSAVASAGDVNGDGYGDALVGAINWSNGQSGEGGAALYPGSASGLGIASWSLEGNQIGAQYGASLASAGDVNGDGYGDVIVGAPVYDAPEIGEGMASVYLGSSGGLGTTAAWTADGDAGNAYFGKSVSGAGDVDGDGYDDVIVGAPGYDGDLGASFVYLGSAAGLQATPAWMVQGSADDASFGSSVASAGDVDGDGYADVIVGAQGLFLAYVYRGSVAGLETSPTWTSPSGLGLRVVASAGDVDGDGYGDVIAGSYLGAYLFEGSPAGPSVAADWSVQDTAGALGAAVASAGDVNGDGYGDVVVGAPWFTLSGLAYADGRAYVYLGSATGLATGAAWVSPAPTASDDQYGYAVAAIDANGDGYSDVLVGAPTHSGGSTDEGKAALSYGNGTDGTGQGLPLAPRALQPSGSAPIAAGLSSSSASGFKVAMVKARGPWGLAPIQLQVEVKALGTPFNGTGLVTSTSVSSTLVGAAVQQAVSGLAGSTGYHWRARVRVVPSRGEKQGWGAWKYGGLSGDPRGAHVFTQGQAVYVDADEDGYGDPARPRQARELAAGVAADATDCDDAYAGTHPGAAELPGTGVSEDCDADEDCYVDADHDLDRTATTTLSADEDCSDPGEALALALLDCDDANAAAHHGATEVSGDGIDEDCDGGEVCFLDGDDDGFRPGATATQGSADPDCNDAHEAVAADPTTDCDDGEGAIHPGATETPQDNTDQDCDGFDTCWADADGDGARGTTGVVDDDQSCDDPGEAPTSAPIDCNDADGGVHPGATETTGDGVDANCDGAEVCFVDGDSDGFRPDATSTVASADGDCDDAGEGVATDPTTDCDDGDAAFHPGATESDCTDPADYNCDDSVGFADVDADGFAACDDCDDGDGEVNADAPEVCNGIDDDCDGGVDNAVECVERDCGCATTSDPAAWMAGLLALLTVRRRRAQYPTRIALP